VKKIDPLFLIGGAALAYFVLKPSFGLRGLGDARSTDISGQEDLVRAIQNFIALESHLESSAASTGDQKFLDALDRAREMRREAMAKLMPGDAEGEAWCCVKHLLGSSMQLSEVGHKHLAMGQKDEAQKYFVMAKEAKDGALAIAAGSKSGAQCNVCRGG